MQRTQAARTDSPVGYLLKRSKDVWEVGYKIVGSRGEKKITHSQLPSSGEGMVVVVMVRGRITNL